MKYYCKKKIGENHNQGKRNSNNQLDKARHSEKAHLGPKHKMIVKF
jgi:hypothetical protein